MSYYNYSAPSYATHMENQSMQSRSASLGEYFADYDEESQMWCVFHTDRNSGHAYSSWADEDSAQMDADKRNGRG